MFALLDGNNFYCSCERVFRPSLNDRPMIVLSNNDGAAIARSNEAKALGIKMGQPWFEVRHFEKTHGLVALSANFPLYADMSDRMMGVASAYAPRHEPYSIDELFLDFAGVRGDLGVRCTSMRAQVLTQVGIACGVGIAPTKTLAKLGNYIAKTAERKPGSYPIELAQVCNLAALSPHALNQIFETTQVEEVWGIGRKISKRLHADGIHTIADLLKIDPSAIRRNFSVLMEKTVLELNGVSCIELEDVPSPKQQIVVSRSFGQPIRRGVDLAHALTEFTAHAATKLRKQSSVAGTISVFIRTSPFRSENPYSACISVPLPIPSADSTFLANAAIAGLRRIYKKGHLYAKAGVMLMDLQSDQIEQTCLDLWDSSDEPGRDKSKLMATIDDLNKRFGRGSVAIAGAGMGADQPWRSKQERRTPNYTTSWEEIPIVRA